MKRRPTVLFYVSGHGFGHSTRIIEVARHLPKDVRVIFKTSATRWLYEFYFDRPLEFYPIELDIGVIQHDSLLLDAEKTLEAYEALVQELPVRVESECEFVRREGVGVIVADIPPAAFEIARRVGIPSVAIGNFSWDWIYRPYVERWPQYQGILEDICRGYRQCDVLLRLPFHGDLSVFPRIEDNPLIARSPQIDRMELRRRLGIAPERKVVLLSFGGFDLERIPWGQVQKLKDYLFIYFLCPVPADNVLHIPNGVLPHVDVVRMSDVVLSKPGYGICAECVLTQTPIVYTDRGEFAEYPCLVEGLERYGRALHIPQAELLAGNWKPWLEESEHLPAAKEAIATNGAETAAERIMSICEGASL